MLKRMNISEEDIFMYVFFPEKLDSGKKVYLDINKNDFRDQFEFCQAFKLNSNRKTPNDFNEKDLMHILNPNIVELFPICINPNDRRINLAAASDQFSQSISAISFKDDDQKYLIRLIRADDQFLLFVFCAENKRDTTLKIKLFPSENTYAAYNISEPIQIKEESKIEKISIEEIPK